MKPATCLLRFLPAFAAAFLAISARANPPVYPYDTDPTPIVARSKALERLKLPAALGVIPRVTCPIYVMEYHIWWRSPYGLEGRPGYGHWDVDNDVDTATRADGGDYWMRDSRHVGYPLPGLYNSEDVGIIRWQLRCLHNTGVDGVFVQMYPEWDRGDTFVGSAIFARILKIAGEEGVKVGIHDEVAFRQGRLAQKPDVMAKRAGEFMKRFGGDPAFLHIDGKPAYAFQYWSRWDNTLTDDQLVGIFKAADEISGRPTYWMPFHGPDDSLFGRPEIPGFVANGDSNMLRRNVKTFYPSDADYSIREMDDRLAGYVDAMKKHPDKFLGIWAYPGFNDSPRSEDIRPFNWMPRRGGLSLVEKLRRYAEVKPNFVMLSSWNDWEENTALEPGLSYDGYAGDPYLYCRILAAAKGKTFVPPPLPPRTSVDPWLWAKLYGVDAEPPQVTFGPGRTVTVSDPDSGVSSVGVTAVGDVWVAFGDHDVQFRNLVPPGPKPDSDAGLPLPPSQAVTFTIGIASLRPQDAAIPAYAGVVGKSSASGWLEIRYPSQHELVQYRGNDFDEPKFPVHAVWDVTGGTTLGAVRKLLEFRRDDTKAGQVSLIWHPTKADDSAPFLLRRLDLFLTQPSYWLLEKPALTADGGKRKTWNLSPEQPGPFGARYVTAKDNAGNVSAPAVLLP